MTLMATDGGNPSRRVIQEVTIIFISALGPEFTNNEWMIWIKENTIQLDAPIIIPKAHDMVGEADDNTVDIYYFFTNEGRFFVQTEYRIIKIKFSEKFILTSIKSSHISKNYAARD